jgi:hypothetical protein
MRQPISRLSGVKLAGSRKERIGRNEEARSCSHPWMVENAVGAVSGCDKQGRVAAMSHWVGMGLRSMKEGTRRGGKCSPRSWIVFDAVVALQVFWPSGLRR